MFSTAIIYWNSVLQVMNFAVVLAALYSVTDCADLHV